MPKSFEWEKQPPASNGGLVVRGGGLATAMPYANGQALGGAQGGVRPMGPIRAISPSLILRFRWTILLTFLLVAGAGSATVWTLTVPQYRSTATLQVSPMIPFVLYKLEDNGQIPYYQQYLNSQVGIIRGVNLLTNVLDRPEVMATNWYKEGKDNNPLWGLPLSQNERLDEALSVSQRARSQLIDISMTTRKPKDAMVIANAVKDQYLKYANEQPQKDEQKISEVLARKADSHRRELQGLTERINNLKRDMGGVAPEVLLTDRTKRLEEKEAELEKLREEIKKIAWQQRELETLKTTAASQPSKSNELRYQSNVEWRQLNNQLRTMRMDLDLKQNRLGDANPEIVALRKRIEVAETSLKDQEHFIDEQWRAQLGQATTNGGENNTYALLTERAGQQMKAKRFEEQVLTETIETQRKGVAQLRESMIELIKMQTEYDRTKATFDEIQERIKKKDMESVIVGSVQEVARATTPTQPFRDRRLMLTGVALFGGLALGLTLAYVRAMFSPAIQELGDLSRTVSAPFLGELPLFREPPKSGPIHEGVAENESIRMVRTALLQRLNGQRGGSAVLVTSAGPGAGKTTMTLHLARSLAQCGKKVLLVDADLRNPSTTERLKMTAGPGLIDLLTGEATDTQAILATETPGLHVLPAGQARNGHDSELLANGAFSGSLHKWRQRYDIVLLDSPAVLPVADAPIMSREADGTIMVVREGHCRYAEVSDALNCLQVAGGRLLGTVFIGSLRRNAYGYGYGYGKNGGMVAALDVKQPAGKNA